MKNNEFGHVTEVHVLTGFLGSGKTTLLKRMLDEYEAQGRKAAVVMNELGDVNLDGIAVDSDVPMAELLGGCICCSIRGDLSLELKLIIDEHAPDVVLIEATGAANPFEMIDGVTETSMYVPLELKSVIVVVDGPELLARSRSGGKTFKLMKEQIRCGTQLLLNKADRLAGEELLEAEQLLRETNGFAPIVSTVRCMVDAQWLSAITAGSVPTAEPALKERERGDAEGHSHPHGHVCGPNCEHGHAHDAYAHDAHADGGQAGEGHAHQAGQARTRSGHASGDTVSGSGRQAGEAGEGHADQAGHAGGEQAEAEAHSHSHTHSSHEHVMALTHYLDQPVDSHAFEAFLRSLPDNVFRAKGIVTFRDSETSSRFLFQYAYKETDFMRINPQGKVHDVAVFIGEHFAKERLLSELAALVNDGGGMRQ